MVSQLRHLGQYDTRMGVLRHLGQAGNVCPMQTMRAVEEPREWHVPEFTLGDRLTKARNDAGISQEQMADLVGCSRRTIVRYENGQSDVPRGVVLAYCVSTWTKLSWLDPDWPEGLVRPEGFEPPTFCSAPDGPDAVVTSIYSHRLDRADNPKDAA
jgi:transcriptional regulator with XRE-family HTH domain